MNQRSNLALLIRCLSIGLAAIHLTGCDSSEDNSKTTEAIYSCETHGPCPRDPAPSESEASSCLSLINDASCGSAFKAYSICAFTAAKCTPEGLSDPDADATFAACNSAYATYTSCLGDKINSPGSGGAHD